MLHLGTSKLNVSRQKYLITSKLKFAEENPFIFFIPAVFIKSEMLREGRENCFCKHQRYPMITIESQNKTIMTDKRHNDVIINYNITNILVTQLELSLQCPP